MSGDSALDVSEIHGYMSQYLMVCIARCFAEAYQITANANLWHRHRYLYLNGKDSNFWGWIGWH
jgi:hypothetical protein